MFIYYVDNCKFLHDRGDYKSGWQLEREWNEKQEKKKRKMEESIKKFGEGTVGYSYYIFSLELLIFV
jgi:RING finger protein 113A